jgi:predicted Zn-dependent peptidase
MYLNPLFEDFELQKEKGVIVEEIRMYQDMPQRHVQDLFLGLLYGDQPAGWNIAGTEANVKGFSREDFINYRAKHYVAQATTVVVAGSFDEAATISKIEALFSGMASTPKEGKLAVVEAQTAPAILAQFKETDQTHMVLGVRSFPVLDPRNRTLQVLSAVLGGGMSSRLFQKLRDEMGVGYYVSADNDPSTDHGVFGVSTGVDSSRVEEVIKAIINEFKKLANELVPAAELKKAKDHLTGSMMLSIETSDAQAQFCAHQEILKKDIKDPVQITAEIEKVTSLDIQTVAKTIFIDKNLNLAIIGRFKDDSTLKPIVTFA